MLTWAQQGINNLSSGTLPDALCLAGQVGPFGLSDSILALGPLFVLFVAFLDRGGTSIRLTLSSIRPISASSLIVTCV